MTATQDPFRHHLELRGRIIDPLTSDNRHRDIAAWDEKVRAAGGPANWRHADDYREETRRRALQGRMNRDLWVFAYGSLMWDPAFLFSEVRVALLTGYRRSFCLKTTLGRGTPDAPGLMAGLDTGGRCHGLAYRIDRKHLDEETEILWKREMILHAYSPQFVPVETQAGAIEALAFVVDHRAPGYAPGLSIEQTASFIATGVGALGSSLEYLENLAGQFEALGIEDPQVRELCELSRSIAAS